MTQQIFRKKTNILNSYIQSDLLVHGKNIIIIHRRLSIEFNYIEGREMEYSFEIEQITVNTKKGFCRGLANPFI